MTYFLKKFVLVLIIISLVFGVGYFGKVQKAEATLPVIDVPHIAESIISEAKTAWRHLIDNWRKILRDIIVKRILDAMVDDIVKWIQGGGDPKFVTDWGGFLEDAFQAGVGDVAKEVGLAALCEPLNIPTQRLLTHAIPRFSERIKCTLDDIVVNVEDFHNNFESGGWIAYGKLLQPQNNHFGLSLMIRDEKMFRGAREREAARLEGLAGGGFLSDRKCTGGFDADGNCLEYTIVTPGDTIGGLAAKAVGKDINYIINVKSYTAAITNAIINRILSEGLALMGDSVSPGGITYDHRDVGYADAGQQDLENQKQQMRREYQKFLNEKQYILNAKNRSLSYARRTLQILEDARDNHPACRPRHNRIQSIKIEVDRLHNETTRLRNIVYELNNLITEVDNLSHDNLAIEMSRIFNNYQRFINQYNLRGTHRDIITGDKRAAANREKENKRNNLEATQEWKADCIFPDDDD